MKKTVQFFTQITTSVLSNNIFFCQNKDIGNTNRNNFNERRRRFSKSILLLGVIVFSLGLLATSCKEGPDEPTPTPINKLYGRWITDHWQAYNDTIFFDSDYYVKDYFPYYFSDVIGDIQYSISVDTIYFNNNPRKFTLKNDTLTIYEFGYIFTPGYPVSHEDITFTKIQ